ncbi:MAG TPA: hypothetical protein VIQ30_24280 [Pseudonocardia sp.]
MITTSPAYQKRVQASHTKSFRADLEQDGVTVAQLVPISGGVDVDRTATHRRTVSCTLADPTGALVPGGAGDLLAPGQALLRPYLGVVLPVVTRIFRHDDTQAALSEWTLTDLYADADGDLVLSYL